jgi:hypothetical protein
MRALVSTVFVAVLFMTLECRGSETAEELKHAIRNELQRENVPSELQSIIMARVNKRIASREKERGLKPEDSREALDNANKMLPLLKQHGFDKIRSGEDFDKLLRKWTLCPLWPFC